MFGKMKLAQFKEVTMPQKAQSAWDGSGLNEIIGAEYKPVLFVGEQLVQGTNFIYYAEQTLMDLGRDRRLVRIVINEFSGEYKTESIEVIEP